MTGGAEPDPLLRWRSGFPILESTVYLVSHSLGAMPRAARERLTEYADTWAARGVRAWAEGWWRMALVASCFDFGGRRNKVVSDELNFPSVLYVWEAQRALGARIEIVPSADGITVPLERLLAAIDEETLVVPVSHVLFKSAFIQDLAAITRRAHEVGALVVADLYQSAGTVPVDVTAWEVDFATGGSVKWLCGGPGAGYLYVAPRLRETLRPRLTGWMAHARPFAFETGPIEYAPDATRFLHGTPSIPSLYAARAGYEIVSEVTVPAIRRKSVRQVQLLLDLAAESGLAPHAPARAEERGGMVVLDVPEGEAVAGELLRREVIVDFRPGAGLRISPHFYTKDEELSRVVDEIRFILDSGAHRRSPKPGEARF